MKRQLMTGLFAALAFTAVAQSNEWRNPEVNAVNRAPTARQFLRLRDRRGGGEGRQGTIPELHDLERSLEILLGKNADARPTDFWRTDYNDKDGTICLCPVYGN